MVAAHLVQGGRGAVALVPVQPQPGQRVDDRLVRLLGVPGRVGVLDPEDESAAVVPGERPVEQRRPGQPDVRGAGGRWAEAGPDRAGGAAAAGVRDLVMAADHPNPDPARPRRSAPAATGLVSVPIPSTVTETVWPATIGPTPAGVPVSSTSPGSSVMIAGDELDDLADGEDHVDGAAVLHHLAVQLGADRRDRTGRARSRSTDRAGRTCRSPCPG